MKGVLFIFQARKYPPFRYLEAPTQHKTLSPTTSHQSTDEMKYYEIVKDTPEKREENIRNKIKDLENTASELKNEIRNLTKHVMTLLANK